MTFSFFFFCSSPDVVDARIRTRLSNFVNTRRVRVIFLEAHPWVTAPKKHRSGGEPLTMLCPIWLALELIPTSRANSNVLNTTLTSRITPLW